ncbi:hypothetical protein [Stieleria neptunia]|uniref:hypothetical protein n=1 Tax=Stieleria neptunia TaxID=2527979 RepID=UPI0011A2DFEB|nr:hypothetical protein [Stieleria neptunia]
MSRQIEFIEVAIRSRRPREPYRYVEKYLLRLFIISTLILTCVSCDEQPDDRAQLSTSERGVVETYYPSEPSERELAQRDAANAVLTSNHHHFNGGEKVDVGRLALNNDAFDFMLGRSVSDFPNVFSTAELFTQEKAKTYSNGEHMAPWMDTLRSPFGKSELVFYHLYTEIGLAYGYESQKDDLLIAVNAGKIVAWRFFPLTLY